MTKKSRDFRRDKRAYHRMMRRIGVSDLLFSESVGKIGYDFIEFITEETAKLSTLTEKTLLK